MRKKLLLKTAAALFAIAFILLFQWKNALAKCVCKINMHSKCIKLNDSKKIPTGSGFYPAQDLIIKI